MLQKVKRALSTLAERRSKPLHIEFNLTDHCNLNCKGCSHYSPLAPAEFEPLASLESSMKGISEAENSSLISEVYLIGGETLLYPHLKDAMLMARKYFPGVRLSIFTNGLLLPKMDRDFWETARATDCVMAVTRYPLGFDYEKVENLCRDNGVEVQVFGDRGEDNSFFRLPLDPRKRQPRWLSHFRCGAFGCITVDHGRIFPCSQSACIGHLNSRFGTEFRWEPGDFIPAAELGDARRLLRLRNRPVPFCGYCMHWQPTKYGPSRRTADEWIER